MTYCTPDQLCFPPIAGHTVRANFQGGALSSDSGALLLRGIDRQSGLTARLADAMHDKRHPSYIHHPLPDLFAQHIYQMAAGYADANDANSLRHDPLFEMGLERLPLHTEQDLASAPTFSRLEHSVINTDLYRLTVALVDHFLASYPAPPAAIVLDLDHTDNPTHGQQELAFYNHYYQSYCYLPLFVFEGTSGALVMACLRPGKHPTRPENPMILARLLPSLRHQWPETHLLIRAHRRFRPLRSSTRSPTCREPISSSGSPPMRSFCVRPPPLADARQLHRQRTAAAQAHGESPPTSSRLYEEFSYAPPRGPRPGA